MKCHLRPENLFIEITVEAVYMGLLGTWYSCLLYQLSFISVVYLTGPGRPEDRNMRPNRALSLIRVSHSSSFHCIIIT